MKFNINSPLFKIETNDSFPVKKIKKNKQFDLVLSNFGINTKYFIYLVNKKAKTSKIYFVKDKKNIHNTKNYNFKLNLLNKYIYG